MEGTQSTNVNNRANATAVGAGQAQAESNRDIATGAA